MLTSIFNKIMNRDVRHITFEGEPVHSTVYKYFLRVAGNKTILAIAGIQSLADITDGDPRKAALGAVYAVAACGSREIYKFAGPKRTHDRYKRHFKGDGDLSIDKNGALAALTSKGDKYKPLAEHFVNSNSKIVPVLGIFIIWGWCNPNTPVSALVWTGILADHLSELYRFRKVVKGDWAIVDTPAEKQKQTHSMPDAVPDMA